MSCQATVFASLGRLPSLVQKADATCCASWILAAHETNHTPFWAFPTANLSVGLNLFVVCLQMLILQDPELSLHARSVEASQGSEGTTALQSA